MTALVVYSNYDPDSAEARDARIKRIRAMLLQQKLERRARRRKAYPWIGLVVVYIILAFFAITLA